jgi:hypothetical protein
MMLLSPGAEGLAQRRLPAGDASRKQSLSAELVKAPPAYGWVENRRFLVAISAETAVESIAMLLRK